MKKKNTFVFVVRLVLRVGLLITIRLPTYRSGLDGLDIIFMESLAVNNNTPRSNVKPRAIHYTIVFDSGEFFRVAGTKCFISDGNDITGSQSDNNIKTIISLYRTLLTIDNN